MRKILVFSVLMMFALVIAGCGGSSELAGVDGEIYWEDGGELPAGSTVSVQFFNSSIAGVLNALTEISFEAQGSAPIEFFLEYDEADVLERMTYSATARIKDPDGNLLYFSTASLPVIVQGELVEPVRILVELVE